MWECWTKKRKEKKHIKEKKKRKYGWRLKLKKTFKSKANDEKGGFSQETFKQMNNNYCEYMT